MKELRYDLIEKIVPEQSFRQTALFALLGLAIVAFTTPIVNALIAFNVSQILYLLPLRALIIPMYAKPIGSQEILARISKTRGFQEGFGEV